MLNGIITTLFKIIELIWNAPFWLVVLVIIIFSILYLIGNLFGVFDVSDSSAHSTGYVESSNCTYSNDEYQVKLDKIEHPFVFYDYNGNRCGRGDCFYDSKGCRRSWGDGFYDAEGNYCDWGDSYYDAHGYFRSWGDCFYDTKGNLVYPDE